MVAVAMTACGGDKTENGGSSTPSTNPDPDPIAETDALTETSWHQLEGDELMIDPYRDVDIQFEKNHYCFYWDNNHMSEPANNISGYGSYTYDEATASGTATLKDQNNDQPMGTATFTISGNQMEFTFQGTTYHMTKR